MLFSFRPSLVLTITFSPLCPVPSKIIRKLLLAMVALIVVFEAACWIFHPFPVEPLMTLNLDNAIPGFKKDVQLTFGDDFVRYVDWTGGEKPAGTVRILCVGGLSTQAMLQSAPDTWWGQLHSRLKQQGLKVETASRGFDRAGIIEMAAGMAPIVERLKPDVIILNSGFDDVIIHPADYEYDKDKLANLPVLPKPSGIRKALMSFSQTARFKRWWSKDSDNKKRQNELGRKDVYRKFLEEKRKMVNGDRDNSGQQNGLPRHEGILRMGTANDPLLEYLDGLKAFADIAAKQGAALILTGEASLHDSVMNLVQENSLLAYIALKSPEANGDVPAARPNPAWVMREMERFAAKAEEFAVANQLPWFDLNGKVAKTSDNFFSDVLLTDAGAAEAGPLLVPIVEPVVRAKMK